MAKPGEPKEKKKIPPGQKNRMKNAWRGKGNAWGAGGNPKKAIKAHALADAIFAAETYDDIFDALLALHDKQRADMKRVGMG